MYENTTFQEYLDIFFGGFKSCISSNIRLGLTPALAQMRTLSLVVNAYTEEGVFENMEDVELKHYARLSLPENKELLKEKFLEFITEPESFIMLEIAVETIGNQHQFALDLMMYRHMAKKLEEVNKELKELADELGVQLIEA